MSQIRTAQVVTSSPRTTINPPRKGPHLCSRFIYFLSSIIIIINRLNAHSLTTLGTINIHPLTTNIIDIIDITLTLVRSESPARQLV